MANEMILDKATRLGQYAQGITLTADRIIPDYYNDKSIFEKILSVKALMEWLKQFDEGEAADKQN